MLSVAPLRKVFKLCKLMYKRIVPNTFSGFWLNLVIICHHKSYHESCTSLFFHSEFGIDLGDTQNIKSDAFTLLSVIIESNEQQEMNMESAIVFCLLSDYLPYPVPGWGFLRIFLSNLHRIIYLSMLDITDFLPVPQEVVVVILCWLVDMWAFKHFPE